MIRVFLAFIVLFFIFFLGIKTFRTLSGKEKWQLTKITGYSILCSVLAIGLLTLFVILF